MPKKYKKQSKCKQKNTNLPPEDGRCWFCLGSTDDEKNYGKLLKKENVTSHYFCLLFASGLGQNGDDNEGFYGFRFKDIDKEFRRGNKLRCSYCKELGATIGCSKGSCRISFHFNCGFKHQALFHFYDDFSALCHDHRYEQKVKMNTTDRMCLICLSNVPANDNYITIKAACCANGVFHRQCIQDQANAAGVHFFKCALCNSKDKFQEEMLKLGVYIPDKDAEWELEPNAYADLLERHGSCDVPVCKCPEGRKASNTNSEFELMLCDCCGSSGTHVACSDLKTALDDWDCAQCTEIARKKAEVEASRSVAQSPAATLAALTSVRSPVPIVRAKNMTAQELHNKKIMLKYNGSLSSPTSLPRKNKLMSSSPLFPHHPQISPAISVSSSSSSLSSSSQCDSSSSSRGETRQETRQENQQEKKEKNRKRKRDSSCDDTVRLTKEQRCCSELSIEAQNVMTGYHAAPKPRQTRRSLQAVEALAEIKALSVDELPRHLQQIYNADIFTGKNVGCRLAEAFSVPGEESMIEMKQQEADRSPVATRCRPFNHNRLHSNFRGGERRGERARWRNDAPKRTIRALLRQHKKHRCSTENADGSAIEADDCEQAGGTAGSAVLVETSIEPMAATNTRHTPRKSLHASPDNDSQSPAKKTQHAPLKIPMAATNMRHTARKSLHASPDNNNSQQPKQQKIRKWVYSPTKGIFICRSPTVVRQAKSPPGRLRQESPQRSSKRLFFPASQGDDGDGEDDDDSSEKNSPSSMEAIEVVVMWPGPLPPPPQRLLSPPLSSSSNSPSTPPLLESVSYNELSAREERFCQTPSASPPSPSCLSPCPIIGDGRRRKTSPSCLSPCPISGDGRRRKSSPSCLSPCPINGEGRRKKTSPSCLSPCPISGDGRRRKTSPSCLSPCPISGDGRRRKNTEASSCLLLSYDAFVKLHCTDLEVHDFLGRLARYQRYVAHENTTQASANVAVVTDKSLEKSPSSQQSLTVTKLHTPHYFIELNDSDLPSSDSDTTAAATASMPPHSNATPPRLRAAASSV